MESGCAQLSFLCSNEAKIVRTCGTVIAGVDFFSPPGFLREEPGGQERKRLMMMPAMPGANLVIGQAGFALGALQTLLDTMFGLAHARELGQRGVVRRVRQVVVMLGRTVCFASARP